ncbi:MAG: hypothetical protein RIB67_07230 [Miltoncostaeaceae bacterium]
MPVPRPQPLRTRPRAALAALAGTAALLGLAPAVAQADRPAGTVVTWSHELNQNEFPAWDPERAPVIPPRRWYRVIDGTLKRSGEAGLWFGGVSALPFPPLPLHPREPFRWRTPRRLAAAHRATGLRWDVAVEVWAARRALSSGRAVVSDPRVEAHTRRLSLLDPAYRAEALREIRRIVPRLRNAPYVNFYTGSDEPVTILPIGRARVTPFGRALARDFRRRTGLALPNPLARNSRAVSEQLRWLAWSRYSGARFFRMKAEQAAVIRRLDPDAVISPNDYGFIDGFIPWDYSVLERFADVVEADPYVSFAERDRRGRGRYNPGFAAKFLGDLTGKRVRIITQAFEYSGYEPEVGDLWTWSAQALRAGATDLSLFASDNPRFTRPDFYAGMLSIARAMRGARLPDPPVDGAQVVLYATASEGQAQPHRPGGQRYRTPGDELYTTHSLLGELGHGAFRFAPDTRIARSPDGLAGVRTLWLPRAETLDRVVADRILAWVRSGGTLVLTDPEAFTRTPGGASLADVRSALVGAPIAGARAGTVMEVAPGALGAGSPDDVLTLPVDGPRPRAFGAVPEGAGVVARYIDGSPGALLRTVGAGRVLAFSGDLMAPSALEDPADLVRFVRDVHRWAGGTLDHPAWTWRLPGDPQPERLPWEGAIDPAAAKAGFSTPPPPSGPGA